MKKNGTYRKVKFTITRTGYGQYMLEAHYRGRNIKVHVTDSSLWDDIDKEEREDREDRRYALKSAYGRIVNEYRRMYIDF